MFKTIQEKMISKPDVAPWSEVHLRHAVEAAGVALWSWNVDTDELAMDERGFEIWDIDHSENICFGDLSSRIHPGDRDRVGAAFGATRALVGPFEIDFRIVKNNLVRWISARGQGDDKGIVGRSMFGIFIDVTGRKQVEEAHELLAGEMSHRVKNLLAIAAALTTITSRSTDTTTEMARELTQRLNALGRAHDLVRPVRGQESKAALLGDLLSILLAPYDDSTAFSGRIRISVPRTAVGENAATTLALVIHELATNSLKYGALSAATGLLDVSCDQDDSESLVLLWTERGGPPVEGPVVSGGYGTKLVLRTMSAQLEGSIEREWTAEGLIARLRIKRSRLAS
jgi:two-component sensor histidine kinase